MDPRPPRRGGLALGLALLTLGALWTVGGVPNNVFTATGVLMLAFAISMPASVRTRERKLVRVLGAEDVQVSNPPLPSLLWPALVVAATALTWVLPIPALVLVLAYGVCYHQMLQPWSQVEAERRRVTWTKLSAAFAASSPHLEPDDAEDIARNLTNLAQNGYRMKDQPAILVPAPRPTA